MVDKQEVIGYFRVARHPASSNLLPTMWLLFIISGHETSRLLLARALLGVLMQSR